MMRTLALLLVFATLLPAQKTAAPALKGFDPVDLCGGTETPGKDELTATHGRFTYRFATAASKEQFLDDPDRWGIQWGGACARMGPLSGRGDKDRWTVHEKRIYVFASDSCRAGFQKDPDRHIEAARPFPKRPPADVLRGRALLESAAAAHGGAALGSKSALRLVLEGENRGWREKRDLIVTRDGAVSRHVVWTPPEEGKGFDSRWVLGKSGFVKEEGKTTALSKQEIDDVRRIAQRRLIPLLWARHRDDFEVAHLGTGKLGDQATTDVIVRVDGLSTRLHLDPETQKILGISWRGRANSAVNYDVVETFTKWQTIAGVIVPVERSVQLDGKDRASMMRSWDTIELLEKTPAAPFAR